MDDGLHETRQEDRIARLEAQLRDQAIQLARIEERANTRLKALDEAVARCATRDSVEPILRSWKAIGVVVLTALAMAVLNLIVRKD